MINRRSFLRQSGGLGCYWIVANSGIPQGLTVGHSTFPVIPAARASNDPVQDNESDLRPDFKLILQLDWKFNVQFAGVLLADYYNLYRQQGLEVDIRSWDFGLSVTDLVANNPAIISCSEQDVILAAQVLGQPIRAVATMFQHSPLGLMSLPESQVKSLHDLVGRKVGIHSDSQKVMDLVLGFSQISEEDIEVVEISYREKFDKLLAREVDAIQCYVVDEPLGFVDQTGIFPTLLNLSDYGYDAYVQTFFVHHDLLTHHAQQVQQFLQASFAGWKLALTNIPKAAQIVVDHYANPRGKYHNLNYQIQSLNLIADYVAPDRDFCHLGEILPERWQTMAERLAQYHLISQVPALESSINLSLWPT